MPLASPPPPRPIPPTPLQQPSGIGARNIHNKDIHVKSKAFLNLFFLSLSSRSKGLTLEEQTLKKKSKWKRKSSHLGLRNRWCRGLGGAEATWWGRGRELLLRNLDKLSTWEELSPPWRIKAGGGGLSLFQEFSFQNRRLFGDLVNGGVGMEAFKFCRKCVFRFPGK